MRTKCAQPPQVELRTEFSNKELSMAAALIKAYEGEFDPTQFRDLYQERVRKIINAEISDRIPMHPAPKTRTSGPHDLMGADSLDRGRD